MHRVGLIERVPVLAVRFLGIARGWSVTAQGVVTGCGDPQMGGIHARTVWATICLVAEVWVMTHVVEHLPVEKRPDKQFPNHAVS